MKRHCNKRIFVELIILCFLFIVWFWIGYKNQLIGFWDILRNVWKYIYEERTWTIAVFIALIALIAYLFFELKKRKVEPIESTLPKRFPLPILEVKSIKDLGQIVNAIPFMENPAVGKFVEIKEKKTWNDVKKEIDFSKLNPVDLSSQYRVFFIIGKAGAGKSTYMLWSLDKSLQNKSWVFNRIVFLNPNPDVYSLWGVKLLDYDSKKTLLVIDALWRPGDTSEIFIDRCRHLFRLPFEGEIGRRNIGPFKVLVTIREDEYKDLLSLKEFSWISRSDFFEYRITSDNLDFEKILTKYLNSYKIPTSPKNKKEVIKQLAPKLVLKSKGLPFYVRCLFVDLKESKETFSEVILNEYPTGIINLIWEIIKKHYYIEEDVVIPFLLLLLKNAERGFSKHFLNFVKERMAQKEIKKDVSDKIERLRNTFFQSSRAVDIKDSENFTLDSYWKISLERGLEQPSNIAQKLQDVINSYKRISDERFNRLLESIATELNKHLQQAGFKDKADVFLCIDFAKLSEENLKNPEEHLKNLSIATEIYIRFSSLSMLSQEYINYIRDELYELWISNAWKYRAIHQDKDVIKCYENAFDKLGVRIHLKQLSAYAYYLQINVLSKCKYETTEFQQCKEKIEKLYNEVITSQSEQNIEDPITYRALALFCEDLGEDEKAEEAFQKSFQITSLHIPTRQAYAIFLKGRGKREWVKDQIKALEYYQEAEKQFKKAIEILENRREELAPKELEKYEKSLLNSYAKFLIEKTGWEREHDERKKIDEEVDKLFDKLLDKYPNHGPIINAYSHFLMRYGRILPQYRGGKNLEKAKKLIKNFIEAERNKKEKELSYYMALHILATYYHKLEPSFYKQPPNLEEIVKLLKESSRSFSPHHNSIAYNELGQLYMTWANILKKRNPTVSNEKIELAKEAYEKAIEIVPENQQSAIHLSKVYFNYAYYLEYRGSEGQLIEDYIEKALSLAQKFTYIPFKYYYLLTDLGNEMFDDREFKFAKKVFERAIDIGNKLGINVSYATFRCGDIYREEKEIDKALEYYLQSAQLENTSQGWGTRRDSIIQLMKDYNIKKDKNSSLYERCLQTRIQCSKKAYKLNPNDYKNCGDYGEDLSKMSHFQDAIPVLEKGANLILQDSELTELEKRGKVNWHYQEIGFCYRNIGDYPKAEEFFDKSAETEDSAIGYLKHAERLFDLTKYKKAIISFQKFIVKFPSSEEKEKEKIFRDMVDILEKVATSYENLHEECESVLILKDYADISFYSNLKSDTRIYGTIGNRLMKKKKFLEARECFLKAIRLLPDDAQNLSQLGYIDYQLQKWEECKICTRRAYSIRKDPRDKIWLTLCPKKHKNEHRTYDFSKIEDLLNLAIIEELSENNKEALIYYSYALTALEKRGVQDDSVIISKYKFIGNALWSLGKEENTLKIYKEIKDTGTDYEKVIAETIYWFLSMYKSMKSTSTKREAISIRNLQDNSQIIARYLASEKRYGNEERIKKAIAIGSSYLKSNPEDKVIRQAYLELVRKKGLFDIEVIKQVLIDSEEWMKKHNSNQLFQDYICFVENIKTKGLNVKINIDQVKEFGYKFINSIKDGRNARSIIFFANYLRAEKYIDEAGKIYENLLKIKTDPKTKSSIYFSYGQMHLGQAMSLEFTKVERLEKLKEAEEKFRKAFRVNKMHYIALVFLFITLKEQKSEDIEKILKDAEAIMRRVKKKKEEKPSLGEISYKIGNFYLKFDRYEDAIYWLRLARQKDLENFVNWWKLGEAKIKHALILKEKGFHEQSKDLLNKTLSNLKTSLEKAPKFLQLPASKEIPELIRKCENHLQNYNNQE